MRVNTTNSNKTIIKINSTKTQNSQRNIYKGNKTELKKLYSVLTS